MTDPDLARAVLSDALDGLLMALVALDGVEDVEVPVGALDALLGADAAHVEARAEMSLVLDQLRVLLGEEHADLFFTLESAFNTVATTSTDAGFRLGISVAARARS